MKIFYSVLLCFFVCSCYAQDVKKLIRHKVQLGISSGADNSQHSYYILSNLSLHLVSGGTAAIQGFQISGFSNRTLYYTNGMQLSTFSNVSGNRPFRDYRLPEYDVLRGLQISSLVNKVQGVGYGVQIASFNRVTHTFEGLQLGLINSIERGGLGMQIGGLFNFAPKRNSLFQLGLLNYSFTAGLKYEKGFFFLRDHLQIGLINKTYKNHGIQIGLINLSKENEGIPIGLINTNTSHGRGVLAGNELINTYLTVAVGSKYLLNRLSLGYNYVYNQQLSWSGGYGLELQFYRESPLPVPILTFSSDLHYLLRKNEAFKKGVWVNKNSVSYSVKPFKRISHILIGLSYNIGFFSNEILKLDLPYAFSKKRNRTYWPGLDIGFKF